MSEESEAYDARSNGYMGDRPHLLTSVVGVGEIGVTGIANVEETGPIRVSDLSYLCLHEVTPEEFQAGLWEEVREELAAKQVPSSYRKQPTLGDRVNDAYDNTPQPVFHHTNQRHHGHHGAKDDLNHHATLRKYSRRQRRLNSPKNRGVSL